MPKVVTSLINGYYFPRLLNEEEVEEYEKIGYKTCEISQEIFDKWKNHQKEIAKWHNFWMEIDNKIWDQ